VVKLNSARTVFYLPSRILFKARALEISKQRIIYPIILQERPFKHSPSANPLSQNLQGPIANKPHYLQKPTFLKRKHKKNLSRPISNSKVSGGVKKNYTNI